jgi:hypothetical protein
MKPVISVILPTIRPSLIGVRLAEYRAMDAGVPVEVIVVADFAPPMPHSPWYVRERKGVIDAVDLGYKAAQGDYITVTNDETQYGPDTLRALYAAACANPGAVLAPRHIPPFPFFYYGKPFTGFPFVHRDTIAKLGGFFDPAYRAFYSDPDFSMRAHAAGVPIVDVPDAPILHMQSHRRDHDDAVVAYHAADQALFRSRWDHLGAFRDP